MLTSTTSRFAKHVMFGLCATVGVLFTLHAYAASLADCKSQIRNRIDFHAFDSAYSTILYSRCEASVRRLVEVFTDEVFGYGVNKDLVKSIVRHRAIPSNITAAQISAIRHYTRNCLVNYSEVRPNPFGRMLAELSKDIVLVWRKDEISKKYIPVCSGYRNDGFIITARHCLLTNEASRNIEFRGVFKGCESRQLSLSNLKFREIWHPYSEIHVSFNGALHPKAYDHRERSLCKPMFRAIDQRLEASRNDWVKLRVVNPSKSLSDLNSTARESVYKWKSSPVLHRTFVYFGFNKFAFINNLLESNISIEEAAGQAFNVDVSPLCRRLVVDNNLFVHACQTQDDSSGASIFEMSFFEFGENDVVVAELAGINTGTEGFRALCRDSDGGPAKGYFYGYIENTGLRVPNVRPMVRSF